MTQQAHSTRTLGRETVAPVLQVEHISKLFPGIKALDDVHFDLRPGEIHALVGENGAGKSTLIKVLTGVHQPDGGRILMDGKPVVMTDPLVARRHGIAAIYQHLAAYPHLSVAENIFMCNEQRQGKGPFISWRTTHRRAEELLRSLGSTISPGELMGALSVAQQQIAEIAKALSQEARVLIMDEPTAALSRRESEELYNIVRRLRDQGTAIILISHRLEDTFTLADRVSVLRDGRSIGTWQVEEVTADTLVSHMVGRSIDQYYPNKSSQVGEELLRVEGLSRTGFFGDISFSLHAGEILGLTGLVGAGRTEVVEALCGVTCPDTGQIYLKGQPVTVHSPHDALKQGISLLPEDRQKQGLLLPWSIQHNITLLRLDQHLKGGLLSYPSECKVGEEYVRLLSIKAQTPQEPVESLSGGNQQKVVIAKLLTADARILIMDEPTKGVDVGSKAAIYQIMVDLAAQGYGILMVSSEMPEVLNLCDRALVMRSGRISAMLRRQEFTPEKLLSAALPLSAERKGEEVLHG